MKGKSVNMQNSKTAIPVNIKKMAILLTVAYGLNFSGFGLLVPNMSIIGKSLLEMEGAGGMPLSTLSFVSLFSAIPLGKLADKFGRKTAIIIMICFYAIGDLVSLFAYQQSSGMMYLVGMGILGIGVGGMALFTTALTDIFPSAYKGRASGYAQFGTAFGMSVGMLGSGWISTYINVSAVFYVAIACQIVSFILMMTIKTDTLVIGRTLTEYWPAEAFTSVSAARGDVDTNPKHNRPAIQLLFLWPIFLGIFLRIWFHIALSFVNVALPLALTDLGYTLAGISTYTATRALMAFFTADISGRMLDKFGRKIGFIACPAVTITGILMFVIASHPAFLLIGCALIGFGNAIANVTPPAVCNDVTYLPERATSTAIYGISTNVGGFLFPVPIAIILGRIGLTGLCITIAIAFLVPIVLALLTLHETSIGHFKGFELDGQSKTTSVN